MIVWDEVKMAHNKGPEELHKTLQNLNKNEYIMGKVVVI